MQNVVRSQRTEGVQIVKARCAYRQTKMEPVLCEEKDQAGCERRQFMNREGNDEPLILKYNDITKRSNSWPTKAVAQ